MSNIQQATFDALDAIGRWASHEEVKARLPYGGESVSQAIQGLRKRGLLTRRGGHGNGAQWRVRANAKRPVDQRGGDRRSIEFRAAA